MTDDTWIGQTIDGRYIVRRLIGKGGMGAVYEAEQPSLGRKVAIKVLLARDAAFAQRFRREARLASQVVHEHVAQVFDFGRTPDGHDYLVMEYVEGSDLAGLLEQEAVLPVARAVAITRAMLEGLAAIHALGIVHRDVKPSNVLLTRRGDDHDFVKLGDFGLARAADDAKLTKTGNIVGTTPFMAPEVFRGDTIDHRADLYAVGISLYQMLAGKLPFLGPTAEIGALHVWAPPPTLSEHRADLPAWLVSVVERALAKAPADRFADASALIAALDQKSVPAVISQTHAPATVVDRPMKRLRAPRRWPWVLLALAVVGGGAVGAYLAQPEHPGANIPVRDAAVSAPRPVVVSTPPVNDAMVEIDVAPIVAVTVDAGVAHRSPARPSKLRQLCHCMAKTGENSPLCAKQATPRCRCLIVGQAPLCPVELISCEDSEQPRFEDSHIFSDACEVGGMRCPDLKWWQFTRAGTHGATCAGYTTNYRNQGYKTVEINRRAEGHWDCDTCPGANNQTYRGVEGEACTGFHSRTGEPIAGILRHCEG